MDDITEAVFDNYEYDELENLAYEESYKEFCDVMSLYDELIEREVCPVRIQTLRKLQGYYAEDNK